MRANLRSLWAILLWMCCTVVCAQKGLGENVEKKLHRYFQHYTLPSTYHLQPQLLDYRLNTGARMLTLTANQAFALQDFTPTLTAKIYKEVRKILPGDYQGYKIRIVTNGMTIDQLTVDEDFDQKDFTHMWGRISYRGKPWVTNTSNPYTVRKGLANRHLAVYASHGRYYDLQKGVWKWQRPQLFCTTEDLFTPSIVVPFLIPMLENAGAVVFTARERDIQPHEVIVDNDAPAHQGFLAYGEGKRMWMPTTQQGFALHAGLYTDGENPFAAGSALQVKTTRSKQKISLASYTPCLPESGKYAVYVSYQTVDKSIDDAEYIVYHKGQTTHFRVNQQMGGGTWVYLGTFEFDKGASEYNRVVVTNQSSSRGFVTTDAVRFGGGMGNISRGGTPSGLSRAMEGARYSAQWAGAPYSVYSSKQGNDDYKDDINTRPYMTNWLAGGSVYMPGMQGKGVPLELSLAVHSDAGFAKDGKSLVGSLAICTTKHNGGSFNVGVPRMASKILAGQLLNGLTHDMMASFNKWNKRYLWDRNYSETRNPEIPSAIIELLSHQNFPDMRYAQDPNGKFTIARSLYKSILRFVCNQHGRDYVVQPLRPRNFHVRMLGNGKVRLAWSAQPDSLEPTAKPTAYVLYTATGSSGFDNGTVVKGTTHAMTLEPGVLYHFQLRALNEGGRSFPTEVLSAYYLSDEKPTVLVAYNFDRLSAPAVIDNGVKQGFDLSSDFGVGYGVDCGWSGQQIDFNRKTMGQEGPGGLGYSGTELAGARIAGNTFDAVVTHAEAIAGAKAYNIVSCSADAIENGSVNLTDYACIDLILGLQRYTPQALKSYKTFPHVLQQRLKTYKQHRGTVFVSGSYMGSDMLQPSERKFLAAMFGMQYLPTDSITASPYIQGTGIGFNILRQPNAYHYAATHPEVLQPLQPAFCALRYADGNSAAVAYQTTTYRSYAMGFPFECIENRAQRNALMQGILQFLIPYPTQ